jgi:MFS family permease
VIEASIRRNPRGWYYGWNIVGVLMLSQVAANSLTYNSFSMFLNGWSNDLGAPISRFTLAITAMILVASPVSPVVGALADKYPPRRLFAAGLLGMAGIFVAMSFVTRPWHVLALYGLTAVPLTLCTAVPANAVISRWFVRRLGLALGLSAFGIGLGGVAFPPLVAELLPVLGWRGIWRAGAAVIVFVVLPIVVLVLRDRPTEREGLHYLVSDGAPSPAHSHGHGASGAGGPGWREVLSRRNFWILVAVYLSIMGAGGAFTLNIVPFALTRGIGDKTASVLLSIMSIAHVVAALGLGMLADRFGNRVPLSGLALAVAAGIAVLAVGESLPVLMIGAALVGFNSGVFTPLASAISAEFGPQGFGRAFGLAMFFLPFGTPFAFILARTQEGTGSYLPAMIGFIVLLCIAALLGLLLKEAPRVRSDAVGVTP